MRRLIVATSVAALVGISWAGALTVYVNEAAYIAALDETVFEPFNTAPQGTVRQNRAVTLGNLTFRYDGSPDGGQGDPFSGQPLFRFLPEMNSVQFMGEVNADGTPSGLHHFDFFTPVNGFGGNFISSTSGARLTYNTLGQSIPISAYLPAPGTGFFGVVSPTPFSRVTFGVEATTDPSINKSSEVFSLDNVRYGRILPPAPPPPPPTQPVIEEPEPEPPAVPLPAPVLFLLTGLAGLFTFARKRRAA